VHDSRATFITIALANGKTEQWVTDRTGHKSSQMVARYAGQARTFVELGLGTLVRPSGRDANRAWLRRSPRLSGEWRPRTGFGEPSAFAENS
jgi:integrase